MGALVLGVAAGIGALLDAVPAAEVVLKVVGSAYLLWVAFLVVGSGGIGRDGGLAPVEPVAGGRVPVGQPEGVGLHDRGRRHVPARALPRRRRRRLLTGILMVVVVGSSSIWAAGGAALGRVVEDERTRRAVSIVLASCSSPRSR